MMRARSTAAIFALLALAVLMLRPVLLDTIGSPYGAHHSADVQLAYADDSPHCGLLADCETVSITTAGMDAALTTGLLALAGVVMTVTARRLPGLLSWTPQVPNPPPLASLQ